MRATHEGMRASGLRALLRGWRVPTLTHTQVRIPIGVGEGRTVEERSLRARLSSA